jgi:hypothetical protein
MSTDYEFRKVQGLVGESSFNYSSKNICFEIRHRQRGFCKGQARREEDYNREGMKMNYIGSADPINQSCCFNTCECHHELENLRSKHVADRGTINID